jgi:Skp family chaperone for outer membrane proteins
MKYANKYFILSLLSTLSGADIYSVAEGKESMSTNASKDTGTKIAFVDIQRILPTSDDPAMLGKGSKEWSDQMTALAGSLKSGDEELQEHNDTYSKGRTEFDKLRKEFESLQKSGLSSQKALQEKATVLQAKAEDLSRLEYQIQNKMQKRQDLINREVKRAQELLAPKLERIIDDLLHEYDLDLILRKETIVAYRKKSAHAKLDLTDAVLDVLNENYVEEMKAKKAASKDKKDAAPAKKLGAA